MPTPEAALIGAVVAHALVSAALWPGVSTDVVIDGGRGAAEVQTVVAALVPWLAGCVQREGFDVVVEVKVSGPGSVLASAPVILSPDASARISLTCVSHVLETATFKDRGLEPATHLLLRLTDDDAPAPLPFAGLRKALDARQTRIARCVRLSPRRQSLRGEVSARIELDPAGLALSVNVVGTDPVLNSCVQDGLDGLWVSGFPGPRSIVAPFVFAAPPIDERPRAPWEYPTLASWLGCDLPFL